MTMTDEEREPGTGQVAPSLDPGSPHADAESIEPASPEAVSDDDMIVCLDEDGEFYDLVKELGIGRSHRWLLVAVMILVLAGGAAAAAFFIVNS